jgi:hypothetical protein
VYFIAEAFCLGVYYRGFGIEATSGFLQKGTKAERWLAGKWWTALPLKNASLEAKRAVQSLPADLVQTKDTGEIP